MLLLLDFALTLIAGREPQRARAISLLSCRNYRMGPSALPAFSTVKQDNCEGKVEVLACEVF
jgi:hypothetical protein